MDRRSFVRICTLAAGLRSGTLTTPADARARHYARVRLETGRGRPLQASDLAPGEQYVFTYPFTATPCFLLNLGQAAPGRMGFVTADGEPYDWPGGVGPRRSIVAYSAICAHKMTHPTRVLSHISWHSQRTEDDPASGIIRCCSENSAYDPAAGARVIGGPAPQPLATILLEHDEESGALFAIGTLGGEMFARFFDEFAARLEVEYPHGDAQAPVVSRAVVRPLHEYTGNVIAC